MSTPKDDDMSPELAAWLLETLPGVIASVEAFVNWADEAARRARPPHLRLSRRSQRREAEQFATIAKHQRAMLGEMKKFQEKVCEELDRQIKRSNENGK